MYHLKHLAEGSNQGQLTTCIVALYLAKLGISWLGLNDAGDTRKFKSLISFNFGSGETGHSQFTWPIFLSILPLTLVLHVYEVSGNWNESWIGIGYREQPYFLYIDLWSFPQHKKIKSNYRLTADPLWIARTCEQKFSREMSISKKEIEHEELLMDIVHQLRKMIRQLPFPSRTHGHPDLVETYPGYAYTPLILAFRVYNCSLLSFPGLDASL